MDNDIKDIVRENILRYLKKANKTQSDLAEYLGVTRTTVSYWCNGKNVPRMDKLEQIAVFLNTTTYDLMHTEEESMDRTLQKAFDRPEMRMLFSVAKDCTPEDIIQAIKIIEALKK